MTTVHLFDMLPITDGGGAGGGSSILNRERKKRGMTELSDQLRFSIFDKRKICQRIRGKTVYFIYIVYWLLLRPSIRITLNIQGVTKCCSFLNILRRVSTSIGRQLPVRKGPIDIILQEITWHCK